MTYDFKDIAIRSMVTDEHRPTEQQVIRSNQPVDPYEFGSEPWCKTCKQPWPCVPITAFREYDAEQMKAHHARLAEGGYQNELGPW